MVRDVQRLVGAGLSPVHLFLTGGLVRVLGWSGYGRHL